MANPWSSDLDALNSIDAAIGGGGASTTSDIIKVNGNTVLAGNGVTGTGSLRVTIASDNTAFTVNSAQSGVYNITNVSGVVSLPTGASTSALQTTGNTSLSSIDGKTPALGQALAASSVPVVLTAAQITTLTPLSTVAVTQSTSPWVVNQTQMNGVAVSTGNGVVGTGVQRVAIASDNTAFSVNVGTSGLPSGAATSANQATEISSLASIDAGIPAALGQTTMAASMPVTLASNQTNVPTNLAQVNGTTTASGAGATTAGTQRVVLTNDQTIAISGAVNIRDDNGTGIILGQTAMGSSLPVTMAADQSPLGIRFLDGSNTPVIGQQKMVDSSPVVLSNDHSPIDVTVSSGTVSVSGAVTTDIPGPIGSRDNGTAGTQSYAVGGLYHSTLPTMANGNQASLQLESRGRLIVTDDTTKGAKFNGTAAASAVLVSGAYNATLPINTDTQSSALQTDARGRLITVNPTQLPVGLGQDTVAASLSVTLASGHGNVPTDTKKLNGTTIDTGAGSSSAGTQRVIIASNQSSLSVDLQGIVGTEPDVGVAVSGSGTLRVALSTDQQCGGTNRNDTYTGAANGTTVSQCYKNFAIQVVGTGAAATSWTVVLEGSIDNVNFDTILTHTNVTGNGKMVWSAANNYPVNFFRSRCTAVVLGTATNIKAWIMGTT